METTKYLTHLRYDLRNNLTKSELNQAVQQLNASQIQQFICLDILPDLALCLF